MLLIPFEALTGFFDPSVQFGLKFELHPEGTEEGANDAGSPPVTDEAREPTGLLAGPTPLARKKSPVARGEGDEPSADAAENKPELPAEAKVVSIDSFRKKP